MSAVEKRTRSWTFILYPESAPENWVDIISEYHIKWSYSPLHDKDINPTGEQKKPHYHVLLLFDSVKSYEQISEITSSVNATIPKRCESVKGLIRYFAHLDNPEKAQYDVGDIKAFGGLDVAEVMKPSYSERYMYIREMCEFITDNEIIEFSDMINYAINNRPDDWFPLLCDSCSYIIGQHIKSTRHRMRHFKDES